MRIDFHSLISTTIFIAQKPENENPFIVLLALSIYIISNKDEITESQLLFRKQKTQRSR